MGTTIQLTASDGHNFGAYKAEPAGTPKGGVVVIQEIFGVNSHIREVADGYAAAGYLAIAPALFDRGKPGVELGYVPDDIAIGRDLAFPMGWEKPILDIGAAATVAAAGGKVGAVGYCWGGSLAYLAACKLGIQCAVGYYGGQITKILEADPSAKPKVPTILHFGERDAGIPMDMVEAVRSENPTVPIHIYDADHGFNCDHRGSYDEASARVALERTLAFFAENLG
ncbi:MAG: dienelactone hydrolase family protein [Chromatiales bacterium]|jgi:carboxymethylenebutenolidase|nr:dienelactone hydrolase family protein [Chromatiales bacterium]